MEITKTNKNHFYIVTRSINISLEDMNPKADAVLFSDHQKDKVNKVGGLVVFDSPGEYEVKNCMIDAIDIAKDNTAFSVLSEGIRVAYLASIEDVLTDLQLEAFASVDILLVPVKSDKTGTVTKVISQIEPKVVIPHSYSPDELKAFIDELGQEQEKSTKFKVQKKELIDVDQQRLVVIE